MIENPRLDLLIAEHGRTLAIVLVVIGVLALVATGWVVANPSAATTTQEVNQETISTEATTSAVVVEDGLWDEGTVLEDSSVYLHESTPEVIVTPRTTIPSSETSVTHEVRIRHEATRDGSVFWDETTHLSRTSADAESGVATSETSFEIEDIRDRRATLGDQLIGVGTISTAIEIVVEYDTGSNTGEQTLTSPIQITEEAYWFDDSLEDSTSHSETATIDVQESPNPVTIGGLLLVAVLAIGGAMSIHNRESIDVDAARRAVHEQRYAEWISDGSIPMWVGDYHVELDTLEDVVDVAIDTNERVVHDRRRSLFAVVNGSVVYYYSERGQWEGTTWPKMEFGGGSSAAGELGSAGSSSALESGDLLNLNAEDGQDGADDLLDFSEDDLPDPDADDAWDKI